MMLEIWQTEAIENILWATQTVIAATAPITRTRVRSEEYHRGYIQGFKEGVDHVITTFEANPLSPKIWSGEHLRNIIQSARKKTFIMSASTEQTQSADYQQGIYQGLDSALWCIATSLGMSLEPVKHGYLLKQTQPASSDTQLWFRDDIYNILLAIKTAVQIAITPSRNTIQPIAYQQGFEAALQHVAELFGVRLILLTHTLAANNELFFWSRKDIQKKLQMAHQIIPTPQSLHEKDTEKVAYWVGFEVALQGLMTSFGMTL